MLKSLFVKYHKKIKTIKKMSILKKDRIKINDELVNLAKSKIKTDYKDSKGKPVESIEDISILSIEYDDENEDRTKIVVKEVIVNTRLHIQFIENSTSSHNTQFKNNKSIEFKINFNKDDIELIDSDVKFLEQKLF